MSSKNKLFKFQENETFQCLIQPLSSDLMGKDHPLKGNWNKEFFKDRKGVV